MTRYGRYTVAGQHYHNKFMAFQHGIPLGWYPHWDFFDDEFSKVDWQQEPLESLTELYRQRAAQLRADYDYLILWYSGGSDSHTVLQSFLDNGIHLDEIWHRSSVDRVSRRDRGQDSANQANETRHVALPVLKALQHSNPAIKIRVFDAMDLAMDIWQQGTISIDATNYLNPLLPAKMHSDFFNVGRHRGRVAKITALDKPKVFRHDGIWYCSFIDLPLLTQLMQNRIDEQEQDVCFYWHPDAARISVKQSHLIARWFDQRPELHRLAAKDLCQTDAKIRDQIIKSIIYPNWDLETWQVQKPPNDIRHPEFFWFYGNESDVAYQNWHKTAETCSNEIRLLFSDLIVQQCSPLSFSDGMYILPGCWSRAHCIGHSRPIPSDPLSG